MKSVEGETHIRRKTEYVRFAVPRTAGLLSTGGSSKYLFVLNKKAVFISYLIFFFFKAPDWEGEVSFRDHLQSG